MRKIQSYPPKNIAREIKRCNLYFGGLTFLLIFSSAFLLINGKAGSFLSLNSYHPFAFNVFFINYTFMGDGIFTICLILFCFYRKQHRHATALLASFLLSGIIVQLIKNLVYSPRPRAFFEEGQYLFFIEGVSRTGYSSFPSGHTATAFAIATVFILLLKNKKWQLPVLLAAVLVGYSRIYLAQHFLIDVVIGSLIGSLSGIAAFYLAINAKKLIHTFRRFQNKEAAETEQATASIQAA
jgi:membrane-associated phospholipid phosphatase